MPLRSDQGFWEGLAQIPLKLGGPGLKSQARMFEVCGLTVCTLGDCTLVRRMSRVVLTALGFKAM